MNGALALTGRQRLLAIVAGGAVALLILDRVAITPLTALWQRHAAETAQLEKSIAAGASLIDREAQLRRTWTEMESGALPKDPAQAERDVISALDHWGRDSGIEIGTIKPQWKRGATERYSLLECRIDATGAYASLARFLYEVEKSPLALRLEALDLSARDDTGQKLALSLVVTGLRLAPLEGKP